MTEPSLEIITREFGLTYSAAKTTAKDLEKQKQRLFQAINKVVAKGLLAQQIIDCPELEDGELMAEWVLKHYPGWRLKDAKCEEGKLLIEEDPTLAKYRYVNAGDGYVYGRTVANSGPMLDDEKLREEDSDLWREISQVPEQISRLILDTIAILCPQMKITNRVKLVEMVCDLQQVERELIDPSKWTEEQIEKVNKYMIPGRLTLRVEAPRKAKPEELEEAS